MKLLARNALPFTLLLAGFVLWSVAFVVLYGVQATGCRLGWQAIELAGLVTAQRTVLVLLFLGFVAAHFLLYRALSTRRGAAAADNDNPGAFPRTAGRQLALAALGAAIFCFAGVFWLSAC